MQIRRMEDGDLGAVAELFLKAYGTDWVKDKAQQYLAKFHSFEPERCLVAVEDDGKISAAALGYSYQKENGPVLYIQELFVDPDLQKHGYGRELVSKLRDSVSKSSKVSVKPLVKADTRVLNFYNSLGFEKDKAVTFSFED